MALKTRILTPEEAALIKSQYPPGHFVNEIKPKSKHRSRAEWRHAQYQKQNGICAVPGCNRLAELVNYNIKTNTPRALICRHHWPKINRYEKYRWTYVYPIKEFEDFVNEINNHE